MKRYFDVKSMAHMYQEGFSLTEIGKRFGVDRTCVANQLRGFGITIRSSHAGQLLALSRGRGSRHTVNENFFDRVTDKVAWVLGLLTADGCVAKDLSEFQLAVSQELCEKVRRLMSSDCLIQAKPKYSVLRVPRKRMVKALAPFGIAPRKTENLTWPDFDPTLMPHFVRGLWEGDGWIGLEKRKEGRFVLNSRYSTICEPFAVKLMAFLRTTLGIVGCIVRQERVHKNGWKCHVSFKKTDTEKLAQWMYDCSAEDCRDSGRYARVMAYGYPIHFIRG